MAKIYKPQKGVLYVMSGTVKSISEDKTSVTVESAVFNKNERKNEPTEVTFKLAAPLDEYTKENALVTIVANDALDTATMEATSTALYVSTGNKSFSARDLCVVNGNLIAAGYNEEKDANGNPNMTKERTGSDGQIIPVHEKKPHFDIKVSTFEDDGIREDGTPKLKKVLHTIQVYPYDGDMAPIDSLKKRFASFDKETNPMRVTVVTSPGQETMKLNEKDGKTYENHYCTHMGVRSVDIEFTKDRVQARNEQRAQYEASRTNSDATPAQTTATPTQSTPAPAQTVFAPEVEESESAFEGFAEFEE